VELDEVSSASFSDCGTFLVEGEANLNLDDDEIPNLNEDEVELESAFVFTSDDALVVVAAAVDDNPNLIEDVAGADELAGAAGVDADIPNLIDDEAGALEVIPGANKDDELFVGADPGLGFSQQTHLSAVLGTMHTSHVQLALAGGFAEVAGAADTELVTTVLLGFSSGLLEATIPVVLGFGLGTPSPKAPVDFSSVLLTFFEGTSPLSFTSSFFTEELFPPSMSITLPEMRAG